MTHRWRHELGSMHTMPLKVKRLKLSSQLKVLTSKDLGGECAQGI